MAIVASIYIAVTKEYVKHLNTKLTKIALLTIHRIKKYNGE